MALVRVTRTLPAYWQKATLHLQHGKVVRQFLTEQERWMMGGKKEEFFEAVYDPKADRWNLRAVAPRPGGGARR
jgi:hypothetical protein